MVYRVTTPLERQSSAFYIAVASDSRYFTITYRVAVGPRGMLREELSPVRRRLAIASLPNVLRNAGADFETVVHKFVLDALLSPQGMFPSHATDQLSELGPNMWPPSSLASPRPPTPVCESFRSSIQAASAGYRRFFGIPLLRGRDINERDGADAQRVVVIHETLACRAVGAVNPSRSGFFSNVSIVEFS